MPFISQTSLQNYINILLENGFNTTDTSSLSYFFGLARILHEQSTDKVYLDQESESVRDNFIHSIQDIIGIDEVHIFHPMKKPDNGKGWNKGKNVASFVKSNLLTTQYSRAVENYPARSSVLSFSQQDNGRISASLHNQWKNTLRSIFKNNSQTSRIALLVILTRFSEFHTNQSSFEDLLNKVSNIYGIDLHFLFTSDIDVNNFDLDTSQEYPTELNTVLSNIEFSSQRLREPEISYSTNQTIERSTTYISSLPKPFPLLAGISGTGKSRFVRRQAAQWGDYLNNFKLVAVRPDWHEPSDLLGYVSRLSEPPQYVVGGVLQFMVTAWQAVISAGGCFAQSSGSVSRLDISNLDWQAMPPFWLCLDEMNLAPVEQYFADYLAVLETREFQDESYCCHALLESSVIAGLPNESQNNLAEALGLSASDGLWAHFLAHGIALPPNLLVAGTVNMDETTHSFSRKVIDRAVTLDFGEFFPNDFEQFFAPQTEPVALACPKWSHMQNQPDALATTFDTDGRRSIAFLSMVNDVLRGTPFELAYRALNELLLSVACAAPENKAELQAVWDDFLMTKILPRLEGDADKLDGSESAIGEPQSLLEALSVLLQGELDEIWEAKRKDFWRLSLDNNELAETDCRSKRKLALMQVKLDTQGFCSFWP